VSPPVPVRVQHRSGVLWTLNSAGLARVGLTDHLTGACAAPTQLVRHVCSATRTDCRGQPQTERPRRHRCDRRDTDFEVSDIVKLMAAHRRGELRQRVHCLAPGKRILYDGDSTSTN